MNSKRSPDKKRRVMVERKITAQNVIGANIPPQSAQDASGKGKDHAGYDYAVG